MNQICRFLSFIVLLSILPSIAYSENNTLTFRLVHSNNDKLSQLTPSQLKIEQNQYEYFVKDNVGYWVENIIQLSSKDVKDVKIEMMVWEPNSKNWKNVEVSLKEIANDKDYTNPTMHGFTAVIIFNKIGQKKFEHLTEKNIRRRIAIILNGKLLMAPLIQEKITGQDVSVVGLNYNEVKGLKEAIRQ